MHHWGTKDIRSSKEGCFEIDPLLSFTLQFRTGDYVQKGIVARPCEPGGLYFVPAEDILKALKDALRKLKLRSPSNETQLEKVLAHEKVQFFFDSTN